MHPLVSSLLHESVPVPDGLKEGEFYSCLACYSKKIDTSKWNGTLFAQRYNERIVVPGKHAQELLKTWPKITRLYTTISPSEVTVDPELVARKDLPDVSNQLRATQTNACNFSWFEVPNKYKVNVGQKNSWPIFTNQMPYVERIVEYPETGDPIVFVDNHDKIDRLVADYNSTFPAVESVRDASQGQGGANSSKVESMEGGGCHYPAGGSQGLPVHLLAIGGLNFVLHHGRRRTK
jgi:hypothetical protein